MSSRFNDLIILSFEDSFKYFYVGFAKGIVLDLATFILNFDNNSSMYFSYDKFDVSIDLYQEILIPRINFVTLKSFIGKRYFASSGLSLSYWIL